MNGLACILIFLFSAGYLHAQNYVVITLEEAENRLVKNNLWLMAEKYEIDIAEAELAQARLFENPVISVDHNIYNRNSHRYFDFGAEGQTEVEIEQSLPLFGQRGKQIRMEEYNRSIASYNFEDALREMRKVMVDNYISLYFSIKSEAILSRQIESVGLLLDAYAEQYKKGNIPLMEKSRLQALLLSLQKERNDLEEEILTYEGELRKSIGVMGEKHITPVLPGSMLTPGELPYFDQFSSYILERPDVLSASVATKKAEAAIHWEKSQALPEFSIRGIYDRAGGIYDHYFAAGISLSVPIFNRNQGGIRAARAVRMQQRYRQSYIEEQAHEQLYITYAKTQKAQALFDSVDFCLLDDFNILLEGVESNYRKRNISLLEFIDYYDSYKEACLQLYEIHRDYLLARQELLYVVNLSPFSTKR